MTEIVTIDPRTGGAMERFAFMTAKEIDAKLQAGYVAAQNWRGTNFEERSALLRRIAQRLRAQRDILAAFAVREMGKPVTQARAEVEKCALCCDYFADNCATMLGDEEAPSNAARSYVAFRPLGVIFAIMPWNFPYWQVFRAAVPAIAAGNSVLLKHAVNTTHCALEIERIFTDAKAPLGLFGAILISHGDADTLIADSRIAAVTLTGSERAGVAVASAAGAALKKCVLELGGSDAFVVLADADVERAAEVAVAARYQNNGQSCIAAKRFIVEDPIYDAFCELLVARTGAQRVGNPMDELTEVGPMARADLRDALHEQVTDSVRAGATLALGGQPIERDGFFYQPTVVTDVAPGMPMFDSETFGPAAAVSRAKDESDALRLANASQFGLGGAVWTSDVARGETFAAQMECGGVFINGMVASDPRLPFGGVKKSGYGRELSAFGIREFVNAQTVWIGPAK